MKKILKGKMKAKKEGSKVIKGGQGTAMADSARWYKLKKEFDANPAAMEPAAKRMKKK